MDNGTLIECLLFCLRMEESMKDKLEKYKKILNLSNFDIQIIEEDAFELEGATKVLYNDNKAIIKIKNELSEEEKEKTLIHELLHLVHRDEEDIVSGMAEHNDIDGQILELYERFHERSIEHMARVIYRLCNQ